MSLLQLSIHFVDIKVVNPFASEAVYTQKKISDRMSDSV